MAAKRKIISVSCILIAVLVLMVSCDKDDDSTSSDTVETEEEVTRPDGWSDETHSKSGDPDYEIVFNDDEVGRIDLTIANSDWQAMLTDDAIVSAYGEFGGQSGTGTGIPPGGGIPPVNGGGTGGGAIELTENPMWVPCTFDFKGITWNYVGVRFKGNSSLRDAWTSGTYKIPFRFDFDEFEDTYPEIDDQRFYGFKKLTLSSGYKDDSLIREKVTADIFRALGVPAPRTSFYRLFIDVGDGQGATYFGLYTMVEVPADPMLDEQFGNSDGNLYKPDGTTASFGGGALSEEDFDKETNEDEAVYSDVNSLYTAINAENTDGNIWMSNLEAVFDVDGFLNWLAVNTVIQNWDTYGSMTHNYYLYNDGGLLKWIPWDNNEALKDSDIASRAPLSLDLANEPLDSWPLISRILEEPDYLTVYQEYVATTVDIYFNAATMQPVYDAAHTLIYDYVVGDEGEQTGYTLLSSSSAFINSLNYLDTHVENREIAVDDYLNP